MANHNIGGTSFSKSMNEKISLYKRLVLKAEMIHRDNKGKPTAEEAERYAEASKVCAEIMNMNLSERSTYEIWRRNQLECEANAKEIVDILCPPMAPQKPEASQGNASPYAAPRATASAGHAGTGKTAQEASSGTHTKNATKEVPASTIDKWYKEKPKHGLADIVGMDKQKKLLEREAANLGWDLTDDALSISPTQRYFFYGPPGSGKTYLIEGFAHDMMEQGFQFIQLMGGEIHQSLVGVGEKTVQIAFQEAIDSAPCVIFIDEIENVCTNRGGANVQGHESRLTVAFLEALNQMKNSGKRIVFLGATNYPSRVDGAMRDRAHMVPVPLPDEAVRAQYFAGNKVLGMLSLEDGLTYEYMADQTDNFSFRDMERISDAIKVRAREVALSEYTVLNEDGSVDREKSDKAASEAIKNGKIVLTRTWFDETRKENPPSNKTEMQKELEAFERELGNG